MLLAAVDFDNLHQVLRVLYDEMMPLCSNMTGVAKGIAGLGALFYVAAKVWQSLARAEPIDVYPLLRQLFQADALGVGRGAVVQRHRVQHRPLLIRV